MWRALKTVGRYATIRHCILYIVDVTTQFNPICKFITRIIAAFCFYFFCLMLRLLKSHCHLPSTACIPIPHICYSMCVTWWHSSGRFKSSEPHSSSRRYKLPVIITIILNYIFLLIGAMAHYTHAVYGIRWIPILYLLARVVRVCARALVCMLCSNGLARKVIMHDNVRYQRFKAARSIEIVVVHNLCAQMHRMNDRWNDWMNEWTNTTQHTYIRTRPHNVDCLGLTVQCIHCFSF